MPLELVEFQQRLATHIRVASKVLGSTDLNIKFHLEQADIAHRDYLHQNIRVATDACLQDIARLKESMTLYQEISLLVDYTAELVARHSKFYYEFQHGLCHFFGPRVLALQDNRGKLYFCDNWCLASNLLRAYHIDLIHPLYIALSKLLAEHFFNNQEYYLICLFPQVVYEDFVDAKSGKNIMEINLSDIYICSTGAWAELTTIIALWQTEPIARRQASFPFPLATNQFNEQIPRTWYFSVQMMQPEPMAKPFVYILQPALNQKSIAVMDSPITRKTLAALVDFVNKTYSNFGLMTSKPIYKFSRGPIEYLYKQVRWGYTSSTGIPAFNTLLLYIQSLDEQERTALLALPLFNCAYKDEVINFETFLINGGECTAVRAMVVARLLREYTLESYGLRISNKQALDYMLGVNNEYGEKSTTLFTNRLVVDDGYFMLSNEQQKLTLVINDYLKEQQRRRNNIQGSRVHKLFNAHSTPGTRGWQVRSCETLQQLKGILQQQMRTGKADCLAKEIYDKHFSN